MMSPSEMEKEEEAGATDHHSMFHLWEYKNPLAAIFVFTLVLGAPLSVNKWWHLRVSSNRSGRGVVKLIQGISKRPFLGCVKWEEKSYALLTFYKQGNAILPPHIHTTWEEQFTVYRSTTT